MKNLFTFSALTVATLATVHQVTVGPGLDYSPATITDAVAGDIISFTFGAGHNVVSGSLDNPCQPSGGIYSGNPQDGDIFSVTLNSSDTLWFYCSVPGHCEGGMAMVVNPPSGKTLADYQSAASSASGSSEPSDIGGGVFGPVSAASSAGSASSTAGSAASSSAASSSSAAMSSSTAGSTTKSASSAASAASTASSSASTSASASGNYAAATGVPAAIIAAAGLLALF